MLKPTQYSAAGSNIANLGTALERHCKETAAACEAEWHKAGKAAGLDIWRIENFKVIPWPKNLYGQFYDGDSYIVLNTYGNPASYNYDVFFWLGMYTTQDEAGTAAYKTVELDTFFKDKPVEYREVQGHESERFVSLFPHGIRILSGGVDSGFHHVKPEEYKPRLLQVKGKGRSISLNEVPLSRDSMNSGDVFILDAGLKVFQWNGSKSSGMERNKAGSMCRAIDDERGGKAEVIVMEEGSDRNQDEFWSHLGGYGTVKSSEAGGADASTQVVKKLFKVSDAGGSLQFTEVASGRVARNLLNSNDVFVFDIGSQIIVWIGKGASAQERSKGMALAQDYISSHGRPPYISLCKVLEGGENEVFEAAFDH